VNAFSVYYLLKISLTIVILKPVILIFPMEEVAAIPILMELLYMKLSIPCACR